MKFTPEELKTFINMYYLKDAMAKKDCSPEDKAEICYYILEHDELFEHYTPHIAGLKDFYNIFINKDLMTEVKFSRCISLLNQLSKSPAFNQMKQSRDHYLPGLIELDPTMKTLILSWAKDIQLIQSDEEKEFILERVIENNQLKEEEKQKQELEKAWKQIRGKVGIRHSLNQTDLHKIVSLDYPRDANNQKVIALIKNGAALEERNEFGATPLINAAIAGNLTMTLILLSWGAKVAVVDQDGYTPKLYKLFYSSDHDFSSGTSLKKYMDNSMRIFLGKIEGLEKSYLSDGAIYYSLEQIKADLLSIVQDKQFQNSKPLAALRGYIVNTVTKSEQEAVWQFFMDNCKVDISKESDLLASVNNKGLGSESSLNSTSKLSIDILVNYREKLFGNSENILSTNLTDNNDNSDLSYKE